MSLSIWKNGQKKKLNETVPLVISAQQTSRNERPSGMQNMPKETVSNSYPVKNTQDLSYKGQTYMEKPSSVYKPHKNVHPYNPTMKHRFISTELGYKFTGNQYSISSHSSINPDKSDRKEDKKKKEDNIRTGPSYASTSSGVTK